MRVLEYLSDERVIHTKSAAATLIHITLPPRITHKIITKAYLAERTPYNSCCSLFLRRYVDLCYGSHSCPRLVPSLMTHISRQSTYTWPRWHNISIYSTESTIMVRSVHWLPFVTDYQKRLYRNHNHDDHHHHHQLQQYKYKYNYSASASRYSLGWCSLTVRDHCPALLPSVLSSNIAS